MPDRIFQRVVLPVAGNEHNSVLMITTLDGEQNWVTQLENYKRPDGKPIFQFVRHGPCNACIDSGVGAECPHYERAPWKSKSKDQDIKAIYKAQGESALGDQEMSGMSVSTRTYIIQGIYIKQLHIRPLHIFANPVGLIHVGIDPHGGGKTSNTAIVALANDCGRVVVRSLERQIAHTHDQHKVCCVLESFVLWCCCTGTIRSPAQIQRVKCAHELGDETSHSPLVAMRSDMACVDRVGDQMAKDEIQCIIVRAHSAHLVCSLNPGIVQLH